MEAFTAAADVGASLASIKKKIAVPVATQKAGEVSPAAVDGWGPTGRTSKKIAALVAAQKVGVVSPAAMDAKVHLEVFTR
jgi:hypothetical protein